MGRGPLSRAGLPVKCGCSTPVPRHHVRLLLSSGLALALISCVAAFDLASLPLLPVILEEFMVNYTASTDYSETIRGLWQHEDLIANHRLTWFNATQGLLFAAMALVVNHSASSLQPMIVLVGLGSCALTFLSLELGARAKAELRKWWNDHKGDDYEGPDIVGFYVGPGSWLGYLAPSNLLPLLFGGAWVWIGVDAWWPK
jgi:hypothetical protein